MTNQITTRSGLKLSIEQAVSNGGLDISMRTQSPKPVVLHWGLRQNTRGGWQLPPRSFWPDGTTAEPGQPAVRTALASREGAGRILIRLAQPSDYSALEFALLFPEENRWDSNNGKNYRIEIPAQPAYPAEGAGDLETAVATESGHTRVTIFASLPGPLLLHWGVARHSPQEWLLPTPSMQPPGTVVYQNSAAQTPFVPGGDGRLQVQLDFPEPEAPLGVRFVVQQVNTGIWMKDRGGNFFIPVALPSSVAALPPGDLARLADEIIQTETNKNSWTLMHRFNLCHDFLDRFRGSGEALALLFVWLRFSAIRQLDWQRNYNTQPRDLSHAQDRLTQKMAELYVHQPDARVFVRLMLGCVGRGGEGQKIRDEILAIMHRHRIKEVTGHFMEEWHQKLHNNTTPDDIVICEACLAFLRSNGDPGAFYQTLQDGGVTKSRLESFERPIRTAPDFPLHLKDGLIHDFEHFLRTLKAVHSGTDFETAINTASYLVDDGMRGLLWYLCRGQNDPHASPLDLVSQATEARRRLSPRLGGSNGTRDLLYLDLALDQFVRTVVERSIHLHLNGDQLVDLTSSLLENATLSGSGAEFFLCFSEWERLKAAPRFTREWSLHASAVLDRIGHALGALTDWYQAMLQSKAEYLGNGFHAAPWTIALFSEEVIRGGLASTLSMLVHHLHPVLRETAHLGNWQIISRGGGSGRVHVVTSLKTIQSKVFAEPTVIIADSVGGEEEIPLGVTAVIVSQGIDVLSHVAVRARDAKLLFAVCFDPATIERLKSLDGHVITLEIKAPGDVTFREGGELPGPLAPRPAAVHTSVARPEFTAYAIPEDQFSDRAVGGKSCNLKRLRGKVPAWVHQPASLALPFGVFEHFLALEANRPLRDRFHSLLAGIDGDPPKVLSELRRLSLDLLAPDDLRATLRNVMEGTGLAWPESWDDAWTCIKRVWASKWNHRAWLSRRARGIPDDDLFMAVLIQQVIEAEYAFVIHTVNPATGNLDELYAEVVLGLGDTLVGNYPGSSLSFLCSRKAMQPELLRFPAKRIGLYGSGLIFRSDSNGEDLPGYAGAGLYDSIPLNPYREVVLDYSQERAVWDEPFRTGLLLAIARIGFAIAEAFGSPQDIEGAVVKGEFYVVQTRPQAV
jgi:alpha-glucan,water dikinase